MQTLFIIKETLFWHQETFDGRKRPGRGVSMLSSEDNVCDCELSFTEGIMALHAIYFLPNCVDNDWVHFALNSGLKVDHLTIIVIFMLNFGQLNTNSTEIPEKYLFCGTLLEFPLSFECLRSNNFVSVDSEIHHVLNIALLIPAKLFAAQL